MFYFKPIILALLFSVLFSACWGWGHGHIKPRHIKVKHVSNDISIVMDKYIA